MGWDVMSDPWYNKSRLVLHLVSPGQWKGSEVMPARHSVVGNHLWILLNRVRGEGSPQEIALYELRGRLPGDDPGGWGYKALPVREHLDCPAYMLEADLCPDYYGEWITQVKQERAKARQLQRRVEGLRPKDVVTLYGRRFELLRRSRGGWLVRELTGNASPAAYSMTLAQLRESLAEAAVPAPESSPEASQGALL